MSMDQPLRIFKEGMTRAGFVPQSRRLGIFELPQRHLAQKEWPPGWNFE